jgi:hypothetical protein
MGCNHLDKGTLETMKTLLTALISLILGSLALASNPKIELGALYTQNSTRIICVYWTDGGPTQHVTLIFPNKTQLDVTLEQLYPKSRSITLSKAQVECLRQIVQTELGKQNYILAPIDPVTGKTVVYSYKRVLLPGSANRWKQYLATHQGNSYQESATDTDDRLDQLESKIDDLQDSIEELGNKLDQ